MDDLKLAVTVMEYFRDAFCASSAKLVDSIENDNFEISAVIEIDSGDSRGIFYIAKLEKLEVKDGS